MKFALFADLFYEFLWVEITSAYSQEERNGQEKGKAEDVEGGRGAEGAESQSQLDGEKGPGPGRGLPAWRRATDPRALEEGSTRVRREQAEREEGQGGRP